jgi:hypothetical protein
MAKGAMHRMKVYMSKRMIACDEASFLISLQEDQRLSFRQRWQLRMHLLTCHLCRKYARQIEELSRSMERYRKGCSQESCSHQLSQKASERMDGELDRQLNAK